MWAKSLTLPELEQPVESSGPRLSGTVTRQQREKEREKLYTRDRVKKRLSRAPRAIQEPERGAGKQLKGVNSETQNSDFKIQYSSKMTPVALSSSLLKKYLKAGTNFWTVIFTSSQCHIRESQESSLHD